MTGHRREPVDAVARDIVSAGGSAEAATIDALDEQAVDQHLQYVTERTGRVDISFNTVGIPEPLILGFRWSTWIPRNPPCRSRPTRRRTS